MIVITGATGKTGSHVVQNLVAAGVPVRAMTRQPERARALPELAGAELVAGDPARPESLEAAFAGAERLFLVPPADLCWEQAESDMLRMARRAGIRHVVKLSVLSLEPDPDVIVFRFHRKAERELEASGMAWTHLRPASFMQNITHLFLPLSQSKHVFKMCTGEGRMALIDTRDVADVAARVLTEPGHEGQCYELTGGEALSYAEAAARISTALGRELRYEDVPVADYYRSLLDFGFPPIFAEYTCTVYGQRFRAGDAATVTPLVRQLTGKAPRSIEDFARAYQGMLAPPL